MALLVLAPAGVGGYQLLQVTDAKGCPSHLIPAAGPIQLHLFYEQPAQLAALKTGALASYLSDRMGRPVHVVAVEQSDETGFRLAAAARPLGSEVLAFLAFRPSFPNVPTAQGMVDALGFATPGTACAYVSFLPTTPTLCALGGATYPVQPSYPYLAHEMGHLLGLPHGPNGIMGKGVFKVCNADTFSAGEQAVLRGWGYS